MWSPPAKPCRFASDGPRRVLLDLDERDLGKVALGQTAAVLADAFPQLRAPAVVNRINASVDNAAARWKSNWR